MKTRVSELTEVHRMDRHKIRPSVTENQPSEHKCRVISTSYLAKWNANQVLDEKNLSIAFSCKSILPHALPSCSLYDSKKYFKDFFPLSCQSEFIRYRPRYCHWFVSIL